MFAEVGKKTDVLLRFSTVAGEKGAADAERDVRGFALKFYTGEGNWDLVGNNTPVFFVRDPYKFPDFIHTQKRDPRTNLRNATAMWDFWSLSPESLHQVTILFSDRGLPRNYRQMHGFGSHTYSFINAEERTLVGEVPLQEPAGHRQHQRCGIRGRPSAATARATSATSTNRSSAASSRVAHDGPADERGAGQAHRVRSVRPHQGVAAQGIPADRGRHPGTEPQSGELLRRGGAGQLLARNVVPGIGHSPDKMLQFRVFSYADAHRHRLGVNYEALPVNKPRCPVHNYHRDGAMRFDGNDYGRVNYEPNSFGGPAEDHRFKEPPLPLEGPADRYDHRVGNDDYTQPGNLFRLMTPEQRGRLMDTIAGAMQGVPDSSSSARSATSPRPTRPMAPAWRRVLAWTARVPRRRSNPLPPARKGTKNTRQPASLQPAAAYPLRGPPPVPLKLRVP